MSIKGIEGIKDALEKFKGGGKTGFFQLADDGDSAKVRFLNGGEDDLCAEIVHSVQINGKKRYVVCSGEDDCPLCQAVRDKAANVSYPAVKMFLQLIDRRDGAVKLWERGRKGIPDIIGFVTRYGSLNNRDYEIVRHGKKNDVETTYQLFPMDKSEEELPEKEEIIGENAFVLKLSKSDMKKVVNGTFTLQSGGKTEGASSTGSKGKRKPAEDEDVF